MEPASQGSLPAAWSRLTAQHAAARPAATSCSLLLPAPPISLRFLFLLPHLLIFPANFLYPAPSSTTSTFLAAYATCPLVLRLLLCPASPHLKPPTSHPPSYYFNSFYYFYNRLRFLQLLPLLGWLHREQLRHQSTAAAGLTPPTSPPPPPPLLSIPPPLLYPPCCQTPSLPLSLTHR